MYSSDKVADKRKNEKASDFLLRKHQISYLQPQGLKTLHKTKSGYV